MPILLKFLQEIKEEKTLLNSFDKGNTTLLPKPNKHTRRKENQRPTSLMNINAKKKKPINQPTNQTKPLSDVQKTEFNSILKGLYTKITWDVSLDARMGQHAKISKRDVPHGTIKDKNHVIISVDTEKAVDQLQQLFMTKLSTN